MGDFSNYAQYSTTSLLKYIRICRIYNQMQSVMQNAQYSDNTILNKIILQLSSQKETQGISKKIIFEIIFAM